jgi:hypothetical protein
VRYLRRFLERRWLRDRAEVEATDAEYETVWRMALRVKLKELVFLWAAATAATFALSIVLIAFTYFTGSPFRYPPVRIVMGLTAGGAWAGFVIGLVSFLSPISLPKPSA